MRLTQNHNDKLAVATAVKAGAISVNHNESLVIATAVKAGAITFNHNETAGDRRWRKARRGQRQSQRGAASWAAPSRPAP